MPNHTASVRGGEVDFTDFKNQLYKKMYRYFNQDELEDLAFTLGVDSSELDSKSFSATVRSFIEYVQRRDRLLELLELLIEKRPNVQWPVWPGALTEVRFPFTNRDGEIQHIISSFAPYRIIEAPIGYGKTALLKELRDRFENFSWRSKYIEADGSVQLSDVIHPLFQETHQDNRIQGIVILVDMHRIPDELLLTNLLEQTVSVHNFLQCETTFFAQKPGGFRVIFAGRHMSTLRDKVETDLPLATTTLSTFDFDVIYRSASAYLTKKRNINDTAVRQLAAHLLHLTGGHPGCMAKVIEKYATTGLTSVNQFFLQEWDSILRDDVLPVIDNIRSEIGTSFTGKGIPEFIDTNTLRYFIYPVLEKLMEKCSFEGIHEVVEFADQLTASQLFERDLATNFLHDGVIRRLNTIRLWYKYPENFRQKCLDAREICIDYLKQNDSQLPVRWAVESLFQFLLAHVSQIAEAKQRSELKQQFFTEIVPETFQALTSVAARKEHFLRRDFANLLRGDWEFEFLVNYYLREANNLYTSEPFNQLVSFVSSGELLN